MPRNKVFIAFDLGTTTGIAFGNKAYYTFSRTLKLKKRGVFDPKGFSRFQAEVGSILAGYGPQDDVEIWVEKPHCGPYYHANHILFGLMGILEATAQLLGMKVNFASPASIKKHWAGSGRAGKAEMLRTTNRILKDGGNPPVTDHNESDAIALLSYAGCEELN